MWTCGFMFSICVSFALASQLYSGNGWVPVNSDVVYNQIKHGIRIPQLTRADNLREHNSDALHLVSNHRGLDDLKIGFVSNHKRLEDVKQGIDSNHRGLDDLKIGFVSNHKGLEDTKQGVDSNHRGLHNIITKQVIIEENDNFNEEKEPALGYDAINNETDFQYDNIFLPAPPSNHQNEKNDVPVRRSKKLADIDSQLLFNYITLPKKDKPKNFLKKTIEEAKNSFHTYEVTEDLESVDENQEESKVNKNGYEYPRPIEQNFTIGLTKYLSKYISNNDNLQNYALSRQPKADNRMFINHRHKPILIQVPARYNSLNHLPVDPLLAVFLSNYGHYIQGQYGISNNYNNLYGYLASNNIHNNRPFGFYKVFSDTDSSNR